MTIDFQRAETMITEALLREVGADKVDLILHFGSLLTGNAHKYSDLDLCYIPRHEGTWNHITVIVDDTLVDLFAIPWAQFEAMAEFDDVKCTILARQRIIYQRSNETAERFRALQDRLHELEQTEARPFMLRKALDIFKSAGYHYYLLAEQAARGHRLATRQHAQNLLAEILHCLAVLNQTCVDTRKLDQVLALRKLPPQFADTVERINAASEPADLLPAVEQLLSTTRGLLLAEQAALPGEKRPLAKVLDGGYPELKGDILHLMLACERRDPVNVNLISLYHELMIHMAWAFSGISYSDFNSIADYEQDLAALGFPELLPYVEAQDFDRLHEQCIAFDGRLREYLTENNVALNSFADLDDLQAYLDKR